jgi:hypothetical protein
MEIDVKLQKPRETLLDRKTGNILVKGRGWLTQGKIFVSVEDAKDARDYGWETIGHPVNGVIIVTSGRGDGVYNFGD